VHDDDGDRSRHSRRADGVGPHQVGEVKTEVMSNTRCVLS